MARDTADQLGKALVKVVLEVLVRRCRQCSDHGWPCEICKQEMAIKMGLYLRPVLQARALLGVQKGGNHEPTIQRSRG